IAPVLKPISARVAMWVYPLATSVGIVITANHYWIDGLAGLAVLAVGMWCAQWILERQMTERNNVLTDGGI
ncbi:MAG: phosphatase PAP2 family protein, partial [Actinomycetota bacterium]|nr:phosphatase PAP2 family protein [Actinomycetota bacterium]